MKSFEEIWFESGETQTTTDSAETILSPACLYSIYIGDIDFTSWGKGMPKVKGHPTMSHQRIPTNMPISNTNECSPQPERQMPSKWRSSTPGCWMSCARTRTFSTFEWIFSAMDRMIATGWPQKTKDPEASCPRTLGYHFKILQVTRVSWASSNRRLLESHQVEIADQRADRPLGDEIVNDVERIYIKRWRLMWAVRGIQNHARWERSTNNKSWWKNQGAFTQFTDITDIWYLCQSVSISETISICFSDVHSVSLASWQAASAAFSAARRGGNSSCNGSWRRPAKVINFCHGTMASAGANVSTNLGKTAIYNTSDSFWFDFINRFLWMHLSIVFALASRKILPPLLYHHKVRPMRVCTAQQKRVASSLGGNKINKINPGHWSSELRPLRHNPSKAAARSLQDLRGRPIEITEARRVWPRDGRSFEMFVLPLGPMLGFHWWRDVYRKEDHGTNTGEAWSFW